MDSAVTVNGRYVCMLYVIHCFVLSPLSIRRKSPCANLISETCGWKSIYQANTCSKRGVPEMKTMFLLVAYTRKTWTTHVYMRTKCQHIFLICGWAYDFVHQNFGMLLYLNDLWFLTKRDQLSSFVSFHNPT